MEKKGRKDKQKNNKTKIKTHSAMFKGVLFCLVVDEGSVVCHFHPQSSSWFLIGELVPDLYERIQTLSLPLATAIPTIGAKLLLFAL